MNTKSSRVPTGISRVAFITPGGKCQGGMIRVGGLAIIFLVATYASVGCVVIVTLVTCGTIVRDRSMRPRKRVIITMCGKSSRAPTRVSGMAQLTVRRNTNCLVIRICRLIKSLLVAVNANRGSPCVSCNMASRTLNGIMRTGQREIGVIVIKPAFCTSCRMTGKAGIAVVLISRNSSMLLVRINLIMVMAIDAAKKRVV